jgi:hypothetical protein
VLKWNGASAKEVAGQTSFTFFAQIGAVHTGDGEVAAKTRTDNLFISVVYFEEGKAVFKFDWGEVTEGRMESGWVIKGLDVIKKKGLSMF